jgi:NAD(P)-dependent dehydrogenase (short-subunit alcohol dehydrogenase family)
MNNDRIALVTGAGSGIGRAVSIGLHQGGYRVVLAGRRADELERTAESVSGNERGMLSVPTDVSKPESVGHLFAEIRAKFGRLDLLFNNAGTNAPGVPIEELTLEQWNTVVAVNLTGVFLCAQEAVRLMKAQDPRGDELSTTDRSLPMRPAPIPLRIPPPSTQLSASRNLCRSTGVLLISPVARSISGMQ